MTGALQGLVFTPVDHEVAPGLQVQTGFAVIVTDGIMAAAATDTAVVTALDDAPVITGTGTWLDGYFTVPISLFAGVTVSDPDAGAFETVTVTFSNSGPWSSPTDANGTLSGAGVTKTGVGTYMIAGTPDAVTAALQAAQFTPEPLSTPGFVITGASLSVSDGIAPPSVAQWSALSAGLPIFAGTQGGQTVAVNATTEPFATVTITDSPGLAIEGLTVTLEDATGTPTDADGTLSGPGVTEVGTGIYTLAIQNPASGDTPALITSEVDQMVFTPAKTALGATTTFVLSAFDGATTADNGDTTVTVTAPTTLPMHAALADDTGGSASDGVTSDPTIKGVAAAGALITVTDGSLTLGTTTADLSGGWQFTPVLGDGAHTVTASEVIGGKTSSASVTFVLDTTAPVLSVVLANDTGVSSTDGITSDPAAVRQRRPECPGNPGRRQHDPRHHDRGR